MTTQFKITGGDNRDDLEFQHQQVGRVKDFVPFRLMLETVGGGLKPSIRYRQVEVSIGGIEAEDGSGDCWNITGRLLGPLPDQHIAQALAGQRFEGFYNTRTRKGHINVEMSRPNVVLGGPTGPFGLGGDPAGLSNR